MSQPPASQCACEYHRYDVVHTVDGSEDVFDHSQATWDKHLRTAKPESIRGWSSAFYRHGMMSTELRLVVLQSMAIDMYLLHRDVYKWLTTPAYVPQQEGKGYPIDWLKEMLAKAEGRTSVFRKKEGERKGGDGVRPP
jgi:hypothetical protein